MKFTGNMVALVTPFRNGVVDLAALASLVDRVVDGGVSALVPCGTTGESPTLSHHEHDEVVEFVVKQSAGRVPVIAGAGSNATAEAVRLTRAAERSGASAVLSVSPYYNKPTQDGLIAHFNAIADCSSLPVVLYDIPGRCGVRMSIDTIETLGKHPNIQAIKVASGDVEDVTLIRSRTKLATLSGDDALTLPMLALGGDGVISVLSNILPKEMTQLVHSAQEGNLATAREIHDRLHPLMKTMFLESNPIPVKAALAVIAGIDPEVRLPLTAIKPCNRESVEQALEPFRAQLG